MEIGGTAPEISRLVPGKSLPSKESLLVLRHLERQQKQLGLSMEKVALDRGYDTGAVHRGLELLGNYGSIPNSV